MTAQLDRPAAAKAEADLLDGILRNRHLHSVFQPLVHLGSGSVVGYEALARGPVGDLATPDRLFAAARRAGRLQELDELCRHTAITDANAAGIATPLTLFVNVEPEALDLESLAKLLELTDTLHGGPQLVLEITERALAFQPAALFRSVQRLREAGWRIALDDVGADDLSLAFMPLLRPDVIKLDMQLVQSRPDAAIAQIMNAVNAYAERSGCLLLAEGIETPAHLDMAKSLGAEVGQGWLFGRPATVVNRDESPHPLSVPEPATTSPHPSPLSCLPSQAALRVSSKPLLIEVSKHLERQSARLGATCVLLSTFQQGDQFSSFTADRYRRLASTVGFVGALGEGLTDEPAPGVRGAHLPPGDPILLEWDVVVLAPHFAGALLARDLQHRPARDRDRLFEFALTYDRDTVEHAARTLMSRIQRSPQPTRLNANQTEEGRLTRSHGRTNR